MKNVKCRMQNLFRSAYSTIVAPATKNVSTFCILHSAFLNRRQTNKGIALIMVLGLLAVMILMAVTFAITMRTERLAAGNNADNVRARELVHVGLARALNRLVDVAQSGLGTNGLSSSSLGPFSPQVYPFWPVLSSYALDPPYTNTSANVYLLYATNGSTRANEATNYVPRALWSTATNQDEIAASNHWELIVSPADSNIMGRVKFLILNCSGLLDANYVGGPGARMCGTNPAEIAIGNLGEVGATFLAARGSAVRYETLAQLNAMGGLVEPASNLFVYSRALPGYWKTNNVNPAFNCVGTQVNLSGSAADLVVPARMIAIMSAFTNAGFSEYESGVLFSNLIDYVDADLIPSNFEYCVENVPMINEVVVSNAIEVSAGSVGANRIYKVITDVYVECWSPFVKSAVVSFNLNVTNKFSGTAGFQHAEYVANITYPAGSAPVKYLCCHLEKNIPDQPMVDPIILTTTIDPKIQLGVIVVNGDELKTPIVLTTTHDGNTIGPGDKAASFECLDPRFNNDPANSMQWRSRAVSPSDAPVADVNPWVTGWWLTNLAGDVDFEMHVANGPLQSVAELGYLVYTNAPWKTVKLYGPTCHRVLDVFGLSTNTGDVFMTNIVYRGLVNCNSNSLLDATAVVFAGMPVDQYPGGTPTKILDMTEARAVTTNIFHGGIFTNLSDIGRNMSYFPGATTEFEREAYFRNAFNLINLRQNVFTIIIEAQAASGGNIPRNPAKQRAVAIVWRDPYTGEMFVRHLKWLGD